MNTISREYWFSAAHRIEGHPKCGRLHGHNYKVTVFVTGPTDDHGMVLDYGVMDQIFKPLIDELDHRYIISDDNVTQGDMYADLAAQKGHGVVPHIPFSTAECLAYYFHNKLMSALVERDYRLVVKIQVDETPKSTAVYA